MFTLVTIAAVAAAPDLSKCEKSPENLAATFADGTATLSHDRWGFLIAPELHADGQVAATFTVLEPARQFGYFGQTWSVWPDPTYPDQGYEAGILVRAGKDRGYRVQLSHRYQDVALVKYPDGGFVRSAPCAVKLKTPHAVQVLFAGELIVVSVDGVEKLRYRDPLPPLREGRIGVGTSSAAKVTVGGVSVLPVEAKPLEPLPEHRAHFSVRKWIGGRQWVFDGGEPVLLLPTASEPTCQNVKLRPGYKPQLMWNAFWDIANQGAFKDGTNASTDPEVSGGGASVSAAWSARQTDGRFATKTKLTVGFDAARGTYTYDVDSELTVGEKPFEFRYGYDFEHHTPLDPFQWQHLVVRRKGGQVARRPLYPIDPGVMTDVETYRGQRVWYGRHNEAMQVAPAVEYLIDPTEGTSRTLNTAVCAAFYDTGVSFPSETAKPGTKVRVKYRYTGYPAAEAKGLFESSKVYDAPTLDPTHHYIFADEWPTVTFSKFLPMSEPWAGKTPFMTGHNQRPTYSLAKLPRGKFAMRLGPNSYGAAALPIPAPLPRGPWVVSALVKSVNPHGPGGRIELESFDPKSNKVIRGETHHLGNASHDWKRVEYVTEIPGEAAGLRLGLGNAGTGEVLVGEVTFRPAGGAALPRANTNPPAFPAAPGGAIADYRMEEGSGLHVFDSARGPMGHLELANVDWVTDGGRPALRFADPRPDRKQFPRLGVIERGYLGHPGYKGRDSLPFALAGHHGGGFDLKAFTVAAWVKPAAAMGKSEHGGKGDVVGLGARRIVLRLVGDKAPYKLSATINVNDTLTAESAVAADKWCHVAVTGEPAADGRLTLRLFLDGEVVAVGATEKHRGPINPPPSLILGAEIFYLHDAYYRGLIGRVTAFDRALAPERVRALLRGP